MVPKRPIALYGKIGSVYRRPCFSFGVFVPEENDLQKDCPKLCVLSLLSGRERLLNITKIQSRVGSMGHESYSLETCQKSLQLNLCLEVLPAVIMFKSWHQQSPSMPLSSFMVTWPHASKHLAHQRFFSYLLVLVWLRLQKKITTPLPPKHFPKYVYSSVRSFRNNSPIDW